MPLFHIFGLSFIMLLAVANGEQPMLHIRSDQDRVVADIARKKITVFPGVPTLYTAIVKHPKVKGLDLTSVKICISGGAPLPVEVQQRFEKLTGATLIEGYGLTETSPTGATAGPTDRPGRARRPADAAHHSEVVDMETGTRCCRPARWARSASSARRS